EGRLDSAAEHSGLSAGGNEAATGSSARLCGVQIERFDIGPAWRQRWNEHGLSRSARAQTGFFWPPPSSLRRAQGRLSTARRGGGKRWGRRVLRRLVGSARSETWRGGAARHPPARADREGRRAGYRRIRSCCLQLLARATPAG